MDIVMIGSGNVASVLGRKFIAAGHKIIQIVSRNASAATELAYEWNTESSNYFSVVNKNADVYIIAVSDNALTEIVHDLKLPGKVVAHTAGSVSKDVLKKVSSHYGVFYPLQSIRKDVKHLPDIPIFLEGSDDVATSVLKKLAASISFEQPVFAGSEERMKLHVAAVIVNNFTNHLYALAEQYCKKEGIDFRQLLPLIEETVQRLKTNSPSGTLTGPAIRDDQPTIQKHLALLKDHPHLQKIYQLLTESIQQGK
ncbi:MAG: F420-dependent NADP oxidoreductase [Chitinophagaceae bacterium]